MRITRIDLADIGSPEGLVTKILRDEKDLPIPVPIEDLCYRLDIERIAPLETDGFEGGLLTDAGRSRGIILVKNGVTRQRRRFTIGHELGHFLIPSHIPDEQGRFLCSKRDMSLLTASENDRRARMEVEANRFASLILIPPPFLRTALGSQSTPSIEHMFRLARHFDVSKEAMARSYAGYHDEALAFVVVHEGRVQRIYRETRRFPFVTVPVGQLVPKGSLFHRATHKQGEPSHIDTRLPNLWIDVERGRPAPSVSEQVCLQANGFALIMLWYEPPEEDEEESDERTARQRWKDRQERSGNH